MTLEERNAEIVRLHGLGMTGVAISRQIGLSQSCVHDVIAKSKAQDVGPAPLAIADGILVRLYEITKVSPATLRAKSRKREISRVRQAAMYAIKQRTDWSFPQIAKYMNLLDHTSVIHACRKIPALLDEGDPWIDMLVSAALSAQPVMPLIIDQHIQAIDAHEALLAPAEPVIEIEEEEPEVTEDDPNAAYKRSMQLASAELLTAILRYFVKRRKAA